MKELLTQRMRLEPLEEGHAKALFQGFHDEALEFLSDRYPEKDASFRERCQRSDASTSPGGDQTLLHWALCLRSTKRYVGYVQATLHGDGRASIAYVLFHRAWGHGYVREVAAALIRHLREDWGMKRILADVDTSGLRSIRLLQALGLRRGPVCLNGGHAQGVSLTTWSTLGGPRSEARLPGVPRQRPRLRH